MIRDSEMSQNVKQNDSSTNHMFPNKQTEARTSKGSTSSNGSNSSNNTPQSAESQAKEKLALYVYEYLLHQGATRAAQTFLSEIQWEKNITLGDPPGFLYNWWCVFWDLYSAAPERQDPHNHTAEAKAFHDLNSGTLPSPSTYLPQQSDMSNMVGLPPAGYYPYMNNRYNAGRPPPSIRMTGQPMFQGLAGTQSPFTSMDPSRQQQANSYQVTRNGELMVSTDLWNQIVTKRYNPKMSMLGNLRGYNGIPPVPPNYSRMPSMQNGSMMGGGPLGPTSMGMGPRAPWSNPAATPSPLTPGPPRTPILSSPQGDPTTPFSMDSSEPQLNPLSTANLPGASLSGNNMTGNTMTGTNLPGGSLQTNNLSAANLSADSTDTIDDLPADSTESVAIQRIKESMKEEVKKFETETPEYYNLH